MPFKLLSLSLACIMLLISPSAFCQQIKKMSVASFEKDVFNISKHEMPVDGSGAPKALVKVSSNSIDDDLNAYTFKFGTLSSVCEMHDGELWIYVQKNAKQVTISREGYATIKNYDLRTSLKSGECYRMILNVESKAVYKQMVQFNISPHYCPIKVDNSFFEIIEI